MKKAVYICIVLAVFLNVASLGHCQNMGTKLSRGLANVLTCPMEIPRNIANTYETELGIADSIFLGIPKGIAQMIVRCCAGAYEIVTFPFPIPQGYEPVVQPAYIWEQ